MFIVYINSTDSGFSVHLRSYTMAFVRRAGDNDGKCNGNLKTKTALRRGNILHYSTHWRDPFEVSSDYYSTLTQEPLRKTYDPCVTPQTIAKTHEPLHTPTNHCQKAQTNGYEINNQATQLSRSTSKFIVWKCLTKPQSYLTLPISNLFERRCYILLVRLRAVFSWGARNDKLDCDWSIHLCGAWNSPA